MELKPQAQENNNDSHGKRIADGFWRESEPLLENWDHFDAYKLQLTYRVEQLFTKALMAYISDIPDMAWMKEPRKEKEQYQTVQESVAKLVDEMNYTFSGFSKFLTGLMQAYIAAPESRDSIREQIIAEVTEFLERTQNIAIPVVLIGPESPDE